jgi:hypothetical protein
MLQTIKDESVKNCYCFEPSWRETLLQEYQAYLKSIEQIAAQQIAVIKQAPSAEIEAMFQQLSTQSFEAFPSQTEVESTELIIAIASKAVALIADSGLEKVFPSNAYGRFFKEVLQKFSIEQKLLSLVGIYCKQFQHQKEAVKRNSLIGTVINFKLKAAAMLRQDYDRRYKARTSDQAEINLHIA